MHSDKLSRVIGTLGAIVFMAIPCLGAPPVPSLPGSGTGITDLERSGLKGPVMTVREMKGPDGPPDLTVTYSQSGTMVEQCSYQQGLLKGWNFTLLDSKGRILRKADLTYGMNGQPDPDSWSDLGYGYDSKGDEVLVTGFGPTGTPCGTRRTSNTYSDKGLRTKSTIAYKGNPVPGTPAIDQTGIFGYDAKGRLVKEAWYVSPWTLNGRVTYSYDSVGRCVSMVRTGKDGTTIATEKWRYDGLSRVTLHQETGALGKTVREYRYDHNGFLVGSDETRDGVRTSSMSVDPKSKVAYFTTYRSGSSNTSVVDSNGLTTRQVKRDDKGHLLLDASFRYAFDGKGNWVRMERNATGGTEAGAVKGPEVTYRSITYYPDPVADGGPYFEAAGRVLTGNSGAPGVTLVFNKSLATGTSTVTTDSAGNWFAAGILPGTEVTPHKEGWVFEPASAVLTAENPSLSFKGRPMEAGSVRITEAPPKPEPMKAPENPLPQAQSGGTTGTQTVTETVPLTDEPPLAVPQDPSAAPASIGVGTPVSLRVTPTLGYAVTGVRTGPTAGIQASVDAGRFNALVRGEVVCDFSENNMGIVELGTGYALLPRKDARLNLNAGFGWNTVYNVDESEKATTMHVFGETVLRLESDGDKPKGLEMSLGARYMGDRDNHNQVYLRVGTSGNKTATLTMLAIGITLAAMTSR